MSHHQLYCRHLNFHHPMKTIHHPMMMIHRPMKTIHRYLHYCPRCHRCYQFPNFLVRNLLMVSVSQA